MGMANKWYMGSLDPMEALRVYQYNQNFRAEHPEYFDPDGILVFCGDQGTGKTISAVQYILNLCELYPNVKVCANFKIKLPEHIDFYPWTGVRCFDEIRNGYAGVIYALDEIHLLFNSLESKKLDTSIFETISQQRKQRKHIVGTSQVFTRIAKPFREQFKYAVACNKYMDCAQWNTILDAKKVKIEDDGTVIGSGMKKYFFFHTPELYDSYDTYEVVKKNIYEMGV